MTAQVSSPGTQSMDATHNDVLAEVRNHIGHLTLNRPAGLNALTLDMVRNLQRQLDAWAQDSTVHAVVLRGAGKKPSVPVVTSARCTTASRTATRCTRISLSRNMPWTSPFTTTANRCWR